MGSDGSVSNRELYEAIQNLGDRFDHKIDDLDKRYVMRSTCDERHRYIDPRQIWTAVAALSVVLPILTGVVVRALTLAL